MINITRRERFNAAHKLWNPEWTEQQNREVFGVCANIHGHNWELFVTVKGEVNPETGFVINFKTLSEIIKEEIIQHVDHTYLNEDVSFMKGKLTSAENFAIEIWKILKPAIEDHYNATLHSIKLTETENHYVEYFGE